MKYNPEKPHILQSNLEKIKTAIFLITFSFLYLFIEVRMKYKNVTLTLLVD